VDCHILRILVAACRTLMRDHALKLAQDDNFT